MREHFKKISTVIYLGLVGVFILPSIAVAMPVDAPAGGTIQQRIELRKKEKNVKLDAKELLRYKGRCKGVQNAVRDVQNKLPPIVSNRASIYKKIDAKLWITIGQLKLAEKDTFNLEKQRAELAKRVAAYDSTVAQYRQTLDDIVVMNCEADVPGFVALIQTAREYHQEVRTESADIRSYVVDTVKATLSDFSKDLQPKPSTEQQEKGGGQNGS